MELTVKRMNILKFLWRSINDLVGDRGKRNEIPLLKNIGAFELVRPIFEDKKNNKFQYGTYKDSAGKEYIAKQLSLKDPGIDEYWLRNEINVYSALEKLYGEKGGIIQENFPNIRIPKLASVIDDGERLLILIEKISGKDLFHVPMHERIENIEETINYFRFINHIHDFKKDIPTKRRFFHMLAVLPLASLGALRNYPDQWSKIILGIKEILSNILFIAGQKNMELVHRDIGYSNIIIGDNNMKYIIDFELSSYMHPMWEIAQVMVGCQDKDGFDTAFMQTEIMQEILQDKNLRRLYRLFSIYCGIHLLSTNPPGMNPRKYIDYALNI